MSTSLTLPDSIVSVQDLNMVLLELRGYAKWCAHTAIKSKVKGDAADAGQPPAVQPSTLALLQEWAAKTPLSQARIEALINALEDCKAAAPTVKITLAAPPTNDLRRQLLSWCRTNIAPNALLTIGFNATLLGGMVIASGSHIFDWSFRKQILANRAKFPEVLRRV